MQDPKPTGGLIYVVDDDVNIRKALTIILRKERHQVLEFASGDELRQQLQLKKPDIIFLDVMMPPESGFDICADLRSQASTARVTVFLVTARGMKQDVNKGFAVGADEYVLKPFFTKDVLQLVEKYIQKKTAVV